MRKITLFILLAFQFTSCSKKDDIVPKEIIQFSEKAIDASINSYPLNNLTNPLTNFTNSYFHSSVSKEYKKKFNSNSIIWKGAEHNISLREASLINRYRDNSEYLLKFWVTFKDNREFSYLLQVTEKEGKMALIRFEPLNADIADSFYSPSSDFNIPDFDSNRRQIYFAYISIFITLVIIIFLAVKKRKYLLLLIIPLLFLYNQGMTLYHYKGIEILSPTTHFGLPTYNNIDLHFTNISLSATGVFYSWLIIGFVLFGRSVIDKLNLHYKAMKLETN